MSARGNQHAPLTRFELPVITHQLFLNVMGEGKVEVVAAKDQVIADGHSVKPDFVILVTPNVNQREVGRPAADVTYEDLLPGCDVFFPVVSMRVHPRVERCLWFFNQYNAMQPGSFCRSHRQFASDLVERSRNRQHDILLFEWCVRMFRVPGFSNVADVSRADFYRRKRLHVSRPVPGQQSRSTIDSRMAQPRLCRRDQSPRHCTSMIPREDANSERWLVIVVPWQPQSAFRKFSFGWLIVKRGKSLTPFDLSSSDRLSDREDINRPVVVARFYITDRAVGCSQVDSHDELCPVVIL